MEAEIRKVIDGYVEAIENRDWEAVRTFLSDDFILTNADNGAKGGRERLIAQSQEHISDEKITLSNIKIGVSSDGEMAWARYDQRHEFLLNGVPMMVSGICTNTFEKRDSQWFLTLFHFMLSPHGLASGKRIDPRKHDRNMREYYAKRVARRRRTCENYYQELLAGHDVLEVACGTGERTRVIAETASSVLATDASEEILDVARSYTYPKGNITFQKADAYSLEDINGMFSAGFHSHWFSHIPLSRRDEFLNAFHSKLQPGALVVFGDNSRAGELLDDTGNRYDIRIARDGAKYDIIKNWPTEEELRDMLKEVASDIQYRSFGSTWAISYRLK